MLMFLPLYLLERLDPAAGHGPIASQFWKSRVQPLEAETRRCILEDYFDFPRRDIYAAQREVANAKKQRIESLDDNELVEKARDTVKSTTKGMRRLILLDFTPRRLHY